MKIFSSGWFLKYPSDWVGCILIQLFLMMHFSCFYSFLNGVSILTIGTRNVLNICNMFWDSWKCSSPSLVFWCWTCLCFDWYIYLFILALPSCFLLPGLLCLSLALTKFLFFFNNLPAHEFDLVPMVSFYSPIVLKFVIWDCLKNMCCFFETCCAHYFRVVTIHIHYTNGVTRESLYSKLSLVDLPGSECLHVEDSSGDHVTDLLHVSKSLSA